MTNKTATRIYTVRIDGKERLVNATSPAAAVGHVYGKAGLVEVAHTKDVARLVEAGTPVEEVKAADQPELPL